MGRPLPPFLWTSAAWALLAVSVLFCAAAGAVPNADEDWKFDVVYRTKGRSAVHGLVIGQNDTDLHVLRVFRRPNAPTVVFEDRLPRSDVASVEMLGPKERLQLETRLKTLESERKILQSQIRLWKGGKFEVPPTEALALKPTAWGKDEKAKALAYESTQFRLVSNAREDIVHLTAIQLEQMFAAYVRFLPPRRKTPQPTTIILTASMKEYQALVKSRYPNILNPAFYDSNLNQVVCGSDLERLAEELEKAKEHHEKLRADLKKRREDLNRIYNNKVPVELDKPIRDAFEKIRVTEQKNNDVFKNSHCRLIQRLAHEAFHAYLDKSVFAEKVQVPPWLDEGLAQIFETALVEGGELRVGFPDETRLKKMRDALPKKEMLGLKDLLRAGPRQFQIAHTSEKQLSDSHYLAAWALAFYLTFDRDLLSSSELNDYVKALQRGGDPVQAFQTLVGQPLAKFEADFHLYLKHLGADGVSTPPKK